MCIGEGGFEVAILVEGGERPFRVAALSELNS